MMPKDEKKLYRGPQWYSQLLNRKKTRLGLLAAGLVAVIVSMGLMQVPYQSQAAINQQSAAIPNEQPSRVEKGGFSDIAQMVTPAVVNITVRKEMAFPAGENPFDSLPDFFKGPGRPNIPGFPRGPRPPQGPEGMGAGSGVLVSSDGYLLTNNHVVEGAQDITVTLPDKREFEGKVIGVDPQTDLAVVKIDGKNLPFVQWGDSSHLKVGEYVLAVGNPFGLNSTVTLGIVSALGRGGMGITQYEDFIQTDAAINPGNSGGALVNTKGELVGINTAIFSQSGGYQGVGFAVPTNLAKPVFTSLVSTGKVVRGFLGVGIQEVTQDLAQSFNLKDSSGALVTNVVEGSPADRAGIRRGDVIVEYQDKEVKDPRNLQKYVIGTKVGTSVSMVVIRDGEKKTLNTTIQENRQPARLAQNMEGIGEGPLAGVAVQDLDDRMTSQLGMNDKVEGVVVMEVDPGSQAAKAGLSEGDVISEIDRKPIHSEEDFTKIARQLNGQKQTLVFIHRGNGALYLTIKV